MPKIGDEIGLDELRKLPSIGDEVSLDQLSQYGNAPVAPAKPTSLSDRFKRGFGDQAYKDSHPVVEAPNSKLPGGGVRNIIGKAADYAGASLPFIGGGLGAGGGTIAGFGVGGVPGAAIGVTAGESTKRAIGQAMGVRGNTSGLEETLGTGKEGTIALIGGKALQIGGGYIINRLPKLLGIISGEQSGAVNAALKYPKQADKALADGDEALRKVVATAAAKSEQLKDNFISGYKMAFDKIVGSVKGNISSKKELITAFNNGLKGRGVKVSPRGVLDFSGSKIVANPGEISKINTLRSVIKNWDDWSMRGVNELKQIAQKLAKFPNEAGGSSKSPSIGSFSHNIDSIIKGNIPKSQKAAYSKLNQKFSDGIEMYEDLVDAFNKGDPFTRMAGVFGNNKDTLRVLVNFYETQSKKPGEILGTVAGRALGEERNAAFGLINPRSYIDLFVSPHAQGKFITTMGRAGSAANNAFDKAVNAVQKPSKLMSDFMSR